MTWAASTFLFGGGVAPVLSTAANAIDSITFRYDGTHWVEMSRALAWFGGVPFTTFTAASTTPIAMAAGSLYTANAGSSVFNIPATIAAGEVFAVQRGSLASAGITINANTGQSINGGTSGGSINLGSSKSIANDGLIVLLATSTTTLIVTQVIASDASMGWVFQGNTTFQNNLAIFSSGGVAYHTVAKTANYTTLYTDFLIECTTNAFTITLGSTNFQTAHVQRILNENTAASGNHITLAANSGTIDLTDIPPQSGVDMQWNGTNWYCVGSFGLAPNSSNRAVYSTPAPTSGSTFTISSVADSELHITCTTSASIGVTCGPSTGGEHTIVPTVTAPVGADYSRTIPAGWKVVFTGTVADQRFQRKPCSGGESVGGGAPAGRKRKLFT